MLLAKNDELMGLPGGQANEKPRRAKAGRGLGVPLN